MKAELGMCQAGKQLPLVLPPLAFPGRPRQGSVHFHPSWTPNSQGPLRAAGAIPAHWGISLAISRPQFYLLSPPEQWREKRGHGLPELGPRSQRASISTHKVLIKEKGSTYICSPVSWECILNS